MGLCNRGRAGEMGSVGVPVPAPVQELGARQLEAPELGARELEAQQLEAQQLEVPGRGL